MKKYLFLFFLGTMLLLIPGVLWAGHQNDGVQDTPAILVSLGQANAIPLDDTAAAAVRGQAQYVLVKVFGLNMFDFGPDVQWTWNPLGYRYGNYGGPGWSGQEGPWVDTMDFYFMLHDGVYDATTDPATRLAADQGLLAALTAIANDPDPLNLWGDVYYSNQVPNGAPSRVYVFGFSLIGGRIFTRPVPMVYSEYSRREAVYGMQLLILGKSILRIN